MSCPEPDKSPLRIDRKRLSRTTEVLRQRREPLPVNKMQLSLDEKTLSANRKPRLVDKKRLSQDKEGLLRMSGRRSVLNEPKRSPSKTLS
jgi:hypothetical protein